MCSMCNLEEPEAIVNYVGIFTHLSQLEITLWWLGKFLESPRRRLDVKLEAGADFGIESELHLACYRAASFFENLLDVMPDDYS